MTGTTSRTETASPRGETGRKLQAKLRLGEHEAHTRRRHEGEIPEVQPPCCSVSVENAPIVGAPALRLLSANPGMGSVRFGYRTPQAGRVEARIHDLAGRTLSRPVSAWQPAGEQQGVWDARDDRGERVHAGVYFLSVTLDGQPLGGKKLLIVR